MRFKRVRELMIGCAIGGIVVLFIVAIPSFPNEVRVVLFIIAGVLLLSNGLIYGLFGRCPNCKHWLPIQNLYLAILSQSCPFCGKEYYEMDDIKVKLLQGPPETDWRD